VGIERRATLTEGPPRLLTHDQGGKINMAGILRRTLVLGVILGALTSGLTGFRTASAQAEPNAPPATVDALHPTVSGILVAKPGENNVPIACKDRQAPANPDVLTHRGLVICTAEGKLVLLQINKNTGFYARYWGKYTLGYLTDGDQINAWGVLRDNGYLVNPTYVVQDTDIQEAYTDSQDYITQHFPGRLTLDVLASDSKGPVMGIVFALRRGAVHITLCNGSAGTWSDLKVGKIIDVSNSVYNRRRHGYLDTDTVKVEC
jgi:hypothetical protein